MPNAPTLPSPADLHEDQIIALLRSGAHAALLSAYFGEVEYRELAQLAKIAATRSDPRGEVVFVLPGIMGSRLGSTQRRTTSLLWLHPMAIAQGGLSQLALPAGKSLRALGVMLPGYLKLRLCLEIGGFRPVFHPFDWRADLETLARALTRSIEKSGERKVSIVAHSMGGLVARIALAQDRERRIRKLVQLGAPNRGSFAPVQALRAAYPTVRKIAALDYHNTAEALARSVFLTLPGLYQMLPSTPAEQPNLFDPAQWPQDELAPDATLLNRAYKVRSRMPPPDERCAVIVGTHQETVTSLRLRDGGFEYSVRLDGDGTVPSSNALWDGADTWFVQENHGALTNNSEVLAAVTGILKEGQTSRLSSTRPAAPSEVVRTVTDAELRAAATHKVHWERLSLDSRRRILDPIITSEFITAAAVAPHSS
ncbi:lipase family alpha/beta hydrolase [Steroidobacter sp.]|uniref:lipase family alpha/beta hydrolase n=1 Tax=Steroidobacter sp. TaxID=1978227 RepID=UPI001A42A6E8|nr:alpha/beta fold hydrolase [Steroidobacter sp.]MBL8265052.1 alpha/beta fold hydrolase [Steroidobacter sp.]